jgi:hypothetical protein
MRHWLCTAAVVSMLGSSPSTSPFEPIQCWPLTLGAEMRRREFISLLGGAATWPLAARAQQPTMSVIGFLGPSSPDTFADRLRGFRQGLKETGYVEGENVTIVYRFAENRNDRLPELAADLIRQQVAAITTAGDDVAIAAKATTTTVPIVFIVSQDPVRLGLVVSLAQPGGNATGINFLGGELVAKRLEILRELVPAAARVAVLVNPANAANMKTTLRDMEPAARAASLVSSSAGAAPCSMPISLMQPYRPVAMQPSANARERRSRIMDALTQIRAKISMPGKSLRWLMIRASPDGKYRKRAICGSQVRWQIECPLIEVEAAIAVAVR